MLLNWVKTGQNKYAEYRANIDINSHFLIEYHKSELYTLLHYIHKELGFFTIKCYETVPNLKKFCKTFNVDDYLESQKEDIILSLKKLTYVDIIFKENHYIFYDEVDKIDIIVPFFTKDAILEAKIYNYRGKLWRHNNKNLTN